MTPAIVILCTCPNESSAALLASQLVEHRLAACVNVLPAIHSVYRWQDQIERAEESQLIIKTVPQQFQPIQTFLREHHPYEVPEILAIPVLAGDQDYLRWLTAESQ